LSAPALYRQLKRLFARVARRLVGQGRRRDAETLLRASTHWLRHTFGSHSIAAGAALDVVQRNLGHASLATTTIYTNPEMRRRVQESARLSTMASEVRCAIQARKGRSPESG
jgi:site-specific recombinase XerD